MYELELSSAAARFYRKADHALARKIDEALEQLRANPRHPGPTKPLTANLAPRWRYRIGDWRIIYLIDDRNRRVLVSKIANRREAYL